MDYRQENYEAITRLCEMIKEEVYFKRPQKIKNVAYSIMQLANTLE